MPCGGSAANRTAGVAAVNSTKARSCLIAVRVGRGVSPHPSSSVHCELMTHAYRRCRQARAQLVRWQRQLLSLVDALQAARVQQGEAEFTDQASLHLGEEISFLQELIDGSRRLREQQAEYVIDEFREGRFDYVELASDVAETKFSSFLWRSDRRETGTILPVSARPTPRTAVDVRVQPAFGYGCTASTAFTAIR